jgi:hypothetical protein
MIGCRDRRRRDRTSPFLNVRRLFDLLNRFAPVPFLKNTTPPLATSPTPPVLTSLSQNNIAKNPTANAMTIPKFLHRLLYEYPYESSTNVFPSTMAEP